MTKRAGHISVLPLKPWSTSGIDNPINPEWFKGNYEARPGRETGLDQFGVNYVVLEPGAASSLRHWHSKEDEFIFVIDGEPTLINNDGEQRLKPGSYAGFPAGEDNGHHLINQSDDSVTLLVIGARCPGSDVCHYPDNELGPISR